MNKTRLFQHPIPVLVMAALVLFSAASAASHADAAYAVASAVDFVALPEADAVQDISSRTVVLPGEALDPAAPLPEGTAVLIRADGRELSTVSEGETLSALLHRLGICPGPLDTVLADASGEQLMVSIGAEPVGYEQTEEILPYETVRRATPDSQ